MFDVIFKKLRNDNSLAPVPSEQVTSENPFKPIPKAMEVYSYEDIDTHQFAKQRDMANAFYKFCKKHKVLKEYPNLHILAQAYNPNNLGVGGYVTELQFWAMDQGICLATYGG